MLYFYFFLVLFYFFVCIICFVLISEFMHSVSLSLSIHCSFVWYARHRHRPLGLSRRLIFVYEKGFAVLLRVWILFGFFMPWVTENERKNHLNLIVSWCEAWEKLLKIWTWQKIKFSWTRTSSSFFQLSLNFVQILSISFE